MNTLISGQNYFQWQKHIDFQVSMCRGELQTFIHFMALDWQMLSFAIIIASKSRPMLSQEIMHTWVPERSFNRNNLKGEQSKFHKQHELGWQKLLLKKLRFKAEVKSLCKEFLAEQNKEIQHWQLNDLRSVPWDLGLLELMQGRMKGKGRVVEIDS